MTYNANNEENLVVVHVSPQTNEMVETEMAGETDEVKDETKALIEAIRRRAQAEAESAGTLTRETYLNAVRQAREALEGDKLIERDRIEHALAVLQQEAEKNWHLLFKEIAELGDRFQDAAKAAWDAFTAPRSQR
jgi:molecular chaperone GrpE (heat shock protein)